MDDQIKQIRDFAMMYNKVVENCFKRCVYTFNYRDLLQDEIECIDNCADKFVSSNYRLGINFAEVQQKKYKDLQEQHENSSIESPQPTVQ